MNFSKDKLVLGSYCGTSIDIGPALTANIPRNNGQQVHRSTYKALTTYELVNTDNIKARDEFDTAIDGKLVTVALAKILRVTRRLLHRILISMIMMRSIKITCLRWMTLRLRQWIIILGRK